MTTAQQEFCNQIIIEYVNQAESERDRVFISTQDQMFRRYMLILKRVYAKIIYDYFRVYHEDDVNFCTEEEIQIVIDKFNQLCGTDYSVDVTITDFVETGSSSVWDDDLIWDDDDIWSDT